MSKRKIKCARCLNERPIYDHANHHCEACFLITNNANLSAMELTALASLERLKEERDRIAAAVAVLSPCMAVISKSEPYPSKDFFLNQQITKALAILEGRDQG